MKRKNYTKNTHVIPNTKIARNIQEQWSDVHKIILDRFMNLISNNKNNIFYQRYYIAVQKKIRYQKLTFILIIFIAYIKDLIFISKKELQNITTDMKSSLLGITQFNIIHNNFFNFIFNIIPNVQRATINNWFRRTGFRPINSNWIDFWIENDEVCKTLVYYGPRR